MCSHILALIRMTVSTRTCSSAAELQRSLEIYNEVLPRRAVTSEDVKAWNSAATATVEFLGAGDDVDAGSAAASIHPSVPGICRTFLTVLPQLRRRGVGSALFDAVSAWSLEHGVRELEAYVDGNDEESLGFALRRGFREHSREIGLELELSTLNPPVVGPPAGIEIVSLADHPELAAGAYDVGVEALPDIPGSEDWTPPPLGPSSWRRIYTVSSSSSRSPTERSSATQSCTLARTVVPQSTG
jgi:L-amino acid N-acyltransferase YncA